MVSVITLTYKNFDGLFKTISSVLSQDWPEFEYIVSDDCSGNFPKQKIAEYIENNKKSNLVHYEIIDNEENVGTVKHLNNVIKRCKGEYIFDISCEDYFVDEHVISTMVDTFQKENCDVLIVSRLEHNNGKVCGMCPHYAEWKKINKLDTKEKRLSTFIKAEHFDMFTGQNVYYKKSVIERNGYFDESYRLLEDPPMIAKFLMNEKVCIRPDLFTIVYECKNGVSHNKNQILARDMKRFNLIEKIKYYDYVDSKAKYHIRYVVEREKTKNKLQYLFVTLKYSPRIFSYLIYNLERKVNSIFDRKKIKQLVKDEINIITKE